MSLTLVTGPIGSGKTTKLLERFAAALQRGKALYIVPHESNARDLRRVFLEKYASQGAALAGEAFLSFASFIRLLVPESLPLLRKSQVALRCHELLQQQELRHFEKTSLSFAVAHETASTLLTLKRNFVSPASLHRMLETCGGLKEFDLLNLFTCYQEEHDRRGFLDEGDLYEKAVQAIKGKKIPLGKAIFFDGFFPLSPTVEQIITCITTSHPDIDITLSLPSGKGIEKLTEEVTEAFAEITTRREQLSPPPFSSALIHVIKLRSPLEEAKFHMQELMGLPGDEIRDTVLCTAVHSDFALTLSFLAEGYPLQRLSPALARFFATHFRSLPYHASLPAFSHELQQNLRQDAAFHHWRKHLKDEGLRGPAARSLALLSILDDILTSSLNTNEHIGPLISRRLFIDFLHQELRDATASDHLFAELPCRVRSLEHGLPSWATRLLIPEMCENKTPQYSTRLFFTEQDELGPAPNRLLATLFPEPSRALAIQHYQWQRMVAKAEQEVILSFAACDAKGKEQMPSSFLEGLGVPIFVGPQFISTPKKQNVVESLATRIAIEQERIHGSVVHPEFHGIISNPHAKQLVRDRFSRGHFSPSRLESYAECPMRFFIERVLGIEEEDELTHELKPNDRGTIIHTILEDFFQKHFTRFENVCLDPTSVSEARNIIASLVEAAFQKHSDLFNNTSLALRTFQRKDIQATVENVVMAELEMHRKLENPLIPKAFEWNFGSSEDSAFRLPVPDDVPALIQGRVDRIDVSKDGSSFLIIDYKTGRTIESLRNKIKNGEHFQIPLYTEAVRSLLLKNATPLGGLLYSVMVAEKKHGFVKKSLNGIHYELGNRSHSLLDEDQWEELSQTSMQKAGEIIALIRHGQFAPKEGKACQHCHFKNICRKE
ncbi:MAG: PD-(D/E)XK nuclease family protein [Deltaproteobacteria bacterium]|nr:PD-(D/E)XK nuclease family protein [Deltaproteobacteria bacterium]